MKHQQLILGLVLGMTSFLSAFAQPTTLAPAAAPAPNPPAPQVQTSPQALASYCPPVSALVKEGLWWRSGTNWKCFNQSFVNEIDSFIGAQWVGVQLGKVICMYQGKNTFDFPIALEPITPVPVIEPDGAGWSSNINGYRLCKSTNNMDCAFYVKVETKPKDIYEEIQYQPRIQPSINGLDD